jgi:hypothetical protein
MASKPKTVEPQLLRRLDRSRLAGSSDDMLELAMSDKAKTHFLFRIGGVAIGVITGESQYGEWHKLVGRFKAVTRNGSIFIANAAFLPGDASQLIADKLTRAEGDAQVTFLFDVYVRYDSQLATKYGFIVDRVRKPDEADPLDTLFTDAPALPASSTKALPGPEEGE